jgi:hypothetical protein
MKGATPKMPRPRAGLIVSDGRRDFAVHFIRKGWVYGARYKSTDRRRATLANAQLVRVPREVWDSAAAEVAEIVRAR